MVVWRRNHPEEVGVGVWSAQGVESVLGGVAGVKSVHLVAAGAEKESGDLGAGKGRGAENLVQKGLMLKVIKT